MRHMNGLAYNPLRVFWSYSHADRELRNKLEAHLASLKRANRIENWHDSKIPAGTRWRETIDRELERADIILLLVSAAFLDSEFCHSVELKRAIERHKAGDALVIPIMLRPCDVQDTAIAELQRVPEGGRPITKWGNRDEACQDVVRRLREAIQGWTRGPGDRSEPIAAEPQWRPELSQPPSSPVQVAGEGPIKGPTKNQVLSRIFGLGESVTSIWLDTIRRRGTAVARLHRRDGRPVGSGFLVDPEDFGLPPSDRSHLLTCSFVVGANVPMAIPAAQAVARFEIAGVERTIADVVWESPLNDLRTTLLKLDGVVPGAEPVPIATTEWRPSGDDRIDRVVVAAHPGGRGLEFSLRDTALLDADDWRVHYRAGTEPGSSGGLVLEEHGLQAIAVHSSRSRRMPRLHDRPVPYDACEGISLRAIQRAVRASVARP
jgi:hypothetical protein